MKIYQHLRWPLPSLESSVKIFLLYWTVICFPIPSPSFLFIYHLCPHRTHLSFCHVYSSRVFSSLNFCQMFFIQYVPHNILVTFCKPCNILFSTLCYSFKFMFCYAYISTGDLNPQSPYLKPYCEIFPPKQIVMWSFSTIFANKVTNTAFLCSF